MVINAATRLIFTKHEKLISQITKYVEILLLSETKLDDSIHTPQFSLNDFSNPYRLNRSSYEMKSGIYQSNFDVRYMAQKTQSFEFSNPILIKGYFRVYWC